MAKDRDERPSFGGTDTAPSRLLLVDDDPDVLEFYKTVLNRKGQYVVSTAENGQEAAKLLASNRFDMIVSDVSMPGMDGIQLLRKIREVDLDVPVVLATGGPSLDSAMQAVEYGALRYLTKPIEPAELRKVVEYGVNLHRMAHAKREAFRIVSGAEGFASDRAGLETSFDRALQRIVLHYQPIISWSKRKVIAYEVLVRSGEPSLARPLELFEAAERLGRAQELGRAIRAAVATGMADTPEDVAIYVNVHPRDLDDPELFDPAMPLSRYAHRIVLEVSERASLGFIKDCRSRVADLRGMGYRIAMDDLGAGHAGLATFAQLEPDVVKLDMALVRGSDTEPLRRKLIRSIAELCNDLHMEVITEGIETEAERDAILSAGCDLLQGYLFGKPEAEKKPVNWA